MYINISHLNLSRNVHLSVLFYLDFNNSSNLVLSLIKLHYKFQDKIFNKVENFNSNFKVQNKMPPIIHLSDVWEYTLTQILNCDPKTEVGS